MTYHITITNNETGETLTDVDACAILASVNEGDGTHDHMYSNCGAMDFIETCVGILRLQKQIEEDHPGLLSATAALAPLAEQKTEETETKNEE